MNILKVTQHSEAELIENMRKVGMLTQPEILPYKECYIELHTFFNIDYDIDPAQRYVLESELMKVRDLKRGLQGYGVDLFNLNGYVTIETDESGEPIDVLPPVVECSVETNGEDYTILNDGMHRTYLARMECAPLQCVFVKDCKIPYYAFPLVAGWLDVEMVKDLPEGYIKKWHRIADYKSLYRDFNTGFTNVGGPRGHFVAK